MLIKDVKLKGIYELTKDDEATLKFKDGQKVKYRGCICEILYVGSSFNPIPYLIKFKQEIRAARESELEAIPETTSKLLEVLKLLRLEVNQLFELKVNSLKYFITSEGIMKCYGKNFSWESSSYDLTYIINNPDLIEPCVETITKPKFYHGGK